MCHESLNKHVGKLNDEIAVAREQITSLESRLAQARRILHALESDAESLETSGAADPFAPKDSSYDSITAESSPLQRIWSALDIATTHGTGFTLGFLGTVSNEGRPRIRAVILRRFDQSPERIFFATNVGAQKVAEIREQPQVALTLQDNDSAVQLRMEGTASVVQDPAQRRNAWESLAPHSQQLYASPEVPGTPLTQNVYSAVDDSEMPSAFERFAWIRIDLAWLDWLDLSTEPQQRWQFRLNEGSWRGQRVVP